MNTFTKEHAQELVDSFDVRETLDNEEEVELLFMHNPKNLEALQALVSLADS